MLHGILAILMPLVAMSYLDGGSEVARERTHVGSLAVDALKWGQTCRAVLKSFLVCLMIAPGSSMVYEERSSGTLITV